MLVRRAPGELHQYHGYWCPGFLHHLQGISNHGVVVLIMHGQMSPSIRRNFLIACNISILRNGRKCKYNSKFKKIRTTMLNLISVLSEKQISWILSINSLWLSCLIFKFGIECCALHMQVLLFWEVFCPFSGPDNTLMGWGLLSQFSLLCYFPYFSQWS